MKMPPELFEELRIALAKAPPAETERRRWDMLWASGFPVRKFYDAGLNDNHIATALRRIFKDL